jgi:hypothetical protein
MKNMVVDEERPGQVDLNCTHNFIRRKTQGLGDM